MKIIMLGTGNAAVTKCYNTCFLIENNQDYLLVDAGGGNTILSQLDNVNVALKDIKNIFVTHKHIDHLLGVIWLIRMITTQMNNNKITNDVYLYGHDEVIALLKEFSQKLLLPKQYKYLDAQLHLITVNDGDSFTAIGNSFKAFDIHSTKDKQFGFTMYYDNSKLTCLGDEPYNEANYEYAVNSDYLMHEAFCLFKDKDIFKPYEKHHSTAADAGQLAAKLNVKNLILYHTEDKNLKTRKASYTQEAATNFSGKIYVPDDLEMIEI